jgi:hypothetical protein
MLYRPWPSLDEGESAVFLVPGVSARGTCKACRDVERNLERPVRDLSEPGILANREVIVRITRLSPHDNVSTFGHV